MFLKRLEVGLFGTNAYILADEKTGECAIIDPGGGAKEILKVIKERKFIPRYIINTHGHLDHTFDNRKVKEATAAPILIHEDDADMLSGRLKNFSSLVGMIFKSPPADRILKEGDEIKVGNLRLEVIHTPGHTPGGISLKIDSEKVVFTGDTLFAGGVGRVDLPGGSPKELIRSIKEKLMLLDDEVIILPGHGPESTVGKERRINPFITGNLGL
ncbi:MAG: MBL fold metallo-hydrolase [Armatimonadetes bacterium CG07_land_8_20_14_0_80_40_9]|nr:MAG: MBL fold metallo-hydrolase [Armatimonadetes bacterium CG07_land_8_20_14_0_80_40_9]